MNTWFDVHPWHKYTWISPGGCCRNQTDFIMFSNQFHKPIHKVQTYLGVDVKSNHNSVIAMIKLNMKKTRKPRLKAKFFSETLLVSETRYILDPVENWNHFKVAILSAAESCFLKQRTRRCFHCMTESKDLKLT